MSIPGGGESTSTDKQFSCAARIHRAIDVKELNAARVGMRIEIGRIATVYRHEYKVRFFEIVTPKRPRMSILSILKRTHN